MPNRKTMFMSGSSHKLTPVTRWNYVRVFASS